MYTFYYRTTEADARAVLRDAFKDRTYRFHPGLDMRTGVLVFGRPFDYDHIVPKALLRLRLEVTDEKLDFYQHESIDAIEWRESKGEPEPSGEWTFPAELLNARAQTEQVNPENIDPFDTSFRY